MPKLLTTAGVLTCPHGGTVQIVSQNTVTKAAAPVALATDQFLIAGCPFVLGSAPHPCVRVEWQATARRVTVQGRAALTDASVGLCLAADNAPQGTVVISAPGQTKADGL
jgi:hypothetical protein